MAYHLPLAPTVWCSLLIIPHGRLSKLAYAPRYGGPRLRADVATYHLACGFVRAGRIQTVA
jgi:hypothetical protein